MITLGCFAGNHRDIYTCCSSSFSHPNIHLYLAIPSLPPPATLFQSKISSRMPWRKPSSPHTRSAWCRGRRPRGMRKKIEGIMRRIRTARNPFNSTEEVREADSPSDIVSVASMDASYSPLTYQGSDVDEWSRSLNAEISAIGCPIDLPVSLKTRHQAQMSPLCDDEGPAIAEDISFTHLRQLVPWSNMLPVRNHQCGK